MARDVIKVIHNISQQIMSITDDELADLQKMVDKQNDYINPLKPATSAKIQNIGEHNQKMLDLIKALRDLLIKDKELSEIGTVAKTRRSSHESAKLPPCWVSASKWYFLTTAPKRAYWSGANTIVLI